MNHTKKENTGGPLTFTGKVEQVGIRGGSRISSQGGALKKIAPSGGRLENVWGISCEKSRFYAKQSNFFQFQGAGACAGSLGFASSQTTGFESKTFHERVLSGNKSPVVSQGYQRCRESHSENILEHVMIVTQCLT